MRETLAMHTEDEAPALARQYVQCRLGARIYTWHNDGEHVAAGDLVEVDLPREGPSRLRVLTAWVGNPPNFTTKPCKKAQPPKVDAPSELDPWGASQQ
jgi:hypothetical protein